MVLLLAMACRPVPPDLPSPATLVLPGPSVGVELGLGHGSGRGDLWVRSVASDGTTVPAEDVAVGIGDRLETASLGTDGYARFTTDIVGSHTVSAGPEGGRLFVHPPSRVGAGLRPARAVDARADRDLAAAGSGLLGIVDGVVWWFSREGVPHVVLRPAAPVRGVRGGHLDGDGVEDAVAWTDEAVWLLRGRDAGGVVGLAVLQGDGRQVVGAAMGDADGDGDPDVAVAWADAAGGQVDVWRGDGALAFTSTPNRRLMATPEGITIGVDAVGEQPVVTVVSAGGGWARFYAYRGNWARSGPNVLVDLPPGGAWSAADVLGDGGEELLVAGPVPDDGPRSIQLLDLSEDVREVTLDRPGWLAVADADRNGVADLLFAGPDGRLAWSRTRDTVGALSTSPLIEMPGGGPVGQDPDGSIVVTSPRGWWSVELLGDVDALTPVARSQDSWGPLPAGGAFGLLPGAPARVVLVPDGTAELQVWTERDDIRTLLGRLPLGSGEDPVDLAVCGSTAWLLLGTALVVVDLTDPSAPVETGRNPIAGSHLTCEGDAAWVRSGDDVVRFGVDGLSVGTSLLPGGPLTVLDGVPVTCGGEDCALTTGPFGPGGRPTAVRVTGGEVVVDDRVLLGGGVPTVGDVDGDGRPDLLLYDRGVLTLHRHTTFGFAPAERWWTEDPASGRLQLGDRDGDGLPEIWRIGRGGRIRVGTVPIVDASPDTGDTGMPPDDGTGDTGR